MAMLIQRCAREISVTGAVQAALALISWLWDGFWALLGRIEKKHKEKDKEERERERDREKKERKRRKEERKRREEERKRRKAERNEEEEEKRRKRQDDEDTARRMGGGWRQRISCLMNFGMCKIRTFPLHFTVDFFYISSLEL